MRKALASLAATLFFLLSVGGVDPDMTIGEFVGLYYEEPTEEAEGSELPVIVIQDGELTPEVTVEAIPETDKSSEEASEIVLTPIVEEETNAASEIVLTPIVEEVIPEITLTPVIEEEVMEEPEAEAALVPPVVLEDAVLANNAVPKPEEMVLLEYYSESDVTEVAEVIAAEAKGRDMTQKAAVAWCVLNRVDAWGISIRTAANQAGAFEQANPTEEDLLVARDVLNRWSSEKRGFSNSGRVLPADYKYFSGNGKVNRYREEYGSKDHYDWSLSSPYI